jgi:hypothetical protein
MLCFYYHSERNVCPSVTLTHLNFHVLVTILVLRKRCAVLFIREITESD